MEPVQPPEPIQQPPQPEQPTFMVQEQSPHHHIYRMVIVTVFVIFVAIGGYFLIQRAKVSNNSNENKTVNTKGTTTVQNNQPIIPTPNTSEPFNEQKPWFKLTTEGDKKQYNVGDTIEIVLKGYSEGKDINGYDVLVGYDPEMVDIGTSTADKNLKPVVTSLVQTFEVYPFKKNSYITITSVKKLEVKTPTIFNNDGLVKITSKAKKAGTVKFSILPSYQKNAMSKVREETKMTDKSVNVIIPQLQSIEVAIQ
jgi:hypothetical protein